jgi:hypothetical protein
MTDGTVIWPAATRAMSMVLATLAPSWWSSLAAAGMKLWSGFTHRRLAHGEMPSQ